MDLCRIISSSGRHWRVAAPYQQQALEELELRDGEVAGHHRLQPLEARYADTNVRSLYHRHVVRAVTN